MLRIAGQPDESDILRALASHSNELLVLMRPDGVIAGQLTLGAVPLGYPPEDRYSDRHVAEYVHPDDLARVLTLLEEVRAHPGTETSLQVRARHYEGTWRVLDVDVLDRSNDPLLGGVVLRVTARSDDDEGAREPVEGSDDHRFRSLAEVVPFGILSADRRGYVVHANHEATRILALPERRLYGDGWQAVVEAQDRADLATAAGGVLGSSNRERVTFRANVRGEVRWMNAVFVPLGESGARTGWIATFEDVTDRRRAEMRLAHQATHDPLTGLPNRVLLLDRLSQGVARLQRDPQPLAVLYIDLDRFKPVNDELGHTVGDQVLVEVGRRLTSVTRVADTVGRVGGDEFVVVCEQIDEDEARELGERMISLLAEPFVVAGTTVTVGASVGVCLTSGHETDPAALLAEADKAMYRSKRAGGGAVSLTG